MAVDGNVLQTAGRASSKVFASDIETGNGSEQAIPHRLGRRPTIVVLVPGEGGAAALAQSTPADETNVYVTATNSAKYQVLAMASV